jgi:hypothetical protein
MRLGATATRMGAMLALTLGSVTGAAVAGAPAQAQPTCGPSFSYTANPGVSITVNDGYVCQYKATPGNIEIYKNGQIVAGGYGHAYYICNGTTDNEFAIAVTYGPGASFPLDCG